MKFPFSDYYLASMVGLGQSMRRNYLSISFLLFWLKIYCKIVDLLVHALPGLFFFLELGLGRVSV